MSQRKKRQNEAPCHVAAKVKAPVAVVVVEMTDAIIVSHYPKMLT